MGIAHIWPRARPMGYGHIELPLQGHVNGNLTPSTKFAVHEAWTEAIMSLVVDERTG